MLTKITRLAYFFGFEWVAFFLQPEEGGVLQPPGTSIWAGSSVVDCGRYKAGSLLARGMVTARHLPDTRDLGWLRYCFFSVFTNKP